MTIKEAGERAKEPKPKTQSFQDVYSVSGFRFLVSKSISHTYLGSERLYMATTSFLRTRIVEPTRIFPRSSMSQTPVTKPVVVLVQVKATLINRGHMASRNCGICRNISSSRVWHKDTPRPLQQKTNKHIRPAFAKLEIPGMWTAYTRKDFPRLDSSAVVWFQASCWGPVGNKGICYKGGVFLYSLLRVCKVVWIQVLS